MAKKHNISQTITKILLSVSILQLMYVCFVMIPPSDAYSAFEAEMKAYIPEMTQYAALTATLSLPTGILAEKFLSEIKK